MSGSSVVMVSSALRGLRRLRELCGQLKVDFPQTGSVAPSDSYLPGRNGPSSAWTARLGPAAPSAGYCIIAVITQRKAARLPRPLSPSASPSLVMLVMLSLDGLHNCNRLYS